MRPKKGQDPIVMFDRYKLRFEGVTCDTCVTMYVRCVVDFVEKVPLQTDFDSIPIFVIDSLCFVGECLVSDTCIKPLSGIEFNRLAFPGTNHTHFHEGRKLPEDIFLGAESLHPANYSLDSPRSFPLPLECKDQSITMVIKATLIDRVSGEIIDVDTRTVQLDVWNRTYLLPYF